ncbi:MAG: tRNA pseudouridine(38-40) synthase TruA [Corynebacteriales bacterium]|nr:tRNA pseudouridine(38-40) synthase TruA [Mycobacteriales bacterium]
MTVRIRLDISYDGTGFNGWAGQKGQRTVQGTITNALTTILRTPVALTVAGRTDSGVHATGQVAHVDIPEPLWHDFKTSLVRRLNGIMDQDVRVHAAQAVPADFNARFSALRRHYEYRIADHVSLCDPLRRFDTLWWMRSLDIEAMNAASRHLLGEHDFAAFCRRREGATTIRALERLDWRRDESGMVYGHVSADAFCHSMVRSLVGALLPVGDGRRPVSWPAELLGVKTRAIEVTVAPAHGLALVGVDYPADDELAARTERTRNMRTLATPEGM